MRTKKRALAVIVGAVLSVGLLGAAPAQASSLSCSKTVGSSGGTAWCTGSGTWRVKAVCNYESDKYSGWITQNSGTKYATVPQCTFNIENIIFEVQ
ncbi:hypothetical protein ABT394_12400 [Streptomyces halstedii]|uniref:hypothetical protein n=1 Tax=Streptomyces halstedii TaxID=1944 RepID=UPI003363CD9C